MYEDYLQTRALGVSECLRKSTLLAYPHRLPRSLRADTVAACLGFVPTMVRQRSKRSERRQLGRWMRGGVTNSLAPRKPSTARQVETA
jgi:hypothetical protein